MGRRLIVATLLASVAIANEARADARDLHVAGALVRARQDDALVWEATWVLAYEELDGDPRGTIRFAAPLPAGEAMLPRAGVAPVVEAGRIVGVRVDRARADGRSVEATFVQPMEAGHAPLGAPVADGAAIQIVATDLGAGTRLEIDRDRALDRRVGQAARDEACRLTGYAPEPSDPALYVRGDDVRAARGLRGRVVTIGERTARMSAIVAGLFAAVVALLVLGWRRIRRAAALEQADAVLAREIDALPTRRVEGRP